MNNSFLVTVEKPPKQIPFQICQNLLKKNSMHVEEEGVLCRYFFAQHVIFCGGKVIPHTMPTMKNHAVRIFPSFM